MGTELREHVRAGLDKGHALDARLTHLRGRVAQLDGEMAVTDPRARHLKVKVDELSYEVDRHRVELEMLVKRVETFDRELKPLIHRVHEREFGPYRLDDESRAELERHKREHDIPLRRSAARRSGPPKRGESLDYCPPGYPAEPSRTGALYLAEDGYYVFPFATRGRHPLVRWRSASTRDAGRIERWWRRWPGANVAIDAGKSGCAVLDIDSKAGADPVAIIAGLDLDDCPRVATGIAPDLDLDHPQSLGGERGAHVYFRGETKTGPLELRDGRRKVEGVEMRSRGGCVIAPPSMHASGVEYEGELPPVSELPELSSVPTMVGLLEERRQRNGGSETGPAPPDEFVTLARGVSRGERHASCARLAGYLLRRDNDAQLVFELLLRWDTANTPPMGRAEVEHCVETIHRTEMERRRHGVRLPETQFQGRRVDG